jgi:hypothetical protein
MPRNGGTVQIPQGENKRLSLEHHFENNLMENLSTTVIVKSEGFAGSEGRETLADFGLMIPKYDDIFEWIGRDFIGKP